MSPGLRRRTALIGGLALAALATAAVGVRAQHRDHGTSASGAPMPGMPMPGHRGMVSTEDHPPIRTTMDELHMHGGVPPGWKFAMPHGDPAAGRKVFAKLECYKCHDVHGESFAPVEKAAGNAGPELTGMGAHHPASYFAESIINPNSVIIVAPGYTGPDGKSIMPDFSDAITVHELVDLVAYLKSLTAMPAGTSPSHEQHHR